MPVVSIIIPTYNRAAMLCEAIESVLAQTFTDWELIVVDDGSTDQTPEVLAQYVTSDARIRVLCQANQRHPAARNAAIAISQSRYVAFLDDDDLWLPEKLALQVRYMEAPSQPGLSYTLTSNMDASGRVYRVFPEHPGRTYTELFERNFMACSSVMVRRSCLLRSGFFNTALRRAADYDLWLRIARQEAIEFVPYPLTLYRRHDHNVTSNPWYNYEADLLIFLPLLRDPLLALGGQRRRRRLATVSYEAARCAMERGWWKSAATALIGAVRWAPEVGLVAKRYQASTAGPIYRTIKPYLA